MPVLKNVCIVILGFVVGCIVNISLVTLGPHVVALPEGADVSTPEGLEAAMSLMKPANFIFPYLGHALGTLAGAFAAAKLAAGNKLWFGLGIGALFLLGGTAMVYMVGGPLWFNCLDIITAYIPMGWLGAKLAGESKTPVQA